jgi:hypothetical protein
MKLMKMVKRFHEYMQIDPFITFDGALELYIEEDPANRLMQIASHERE